jgi:NhaA family Na+:H+ antiporter
MRRMGEFRIIAYLVPAVVVWILFYYSGVHATISGVAMAMLIPTKPRYSRSYYLHKADIIEKGIKDADKIEDEYEADEERMYHLRRMKQISDGAYGMSHRMEHLLMPYVNFLIMPIFALANAGVHISSAEYFNIFMHSSEAGSIGMGIFFGLVVGKPLGITLFSYLAIKLGIAEKPAGATMKMLMAVACLGGIGFTMSIFVDNLAFQDPSLKVFVDMGKIAILMASLTAAVVGSIMIMAENKREKK